MTKKTQKKKNIRKHIFLNKLKIENENETPFESN